jgi:uncharacterized membrane protein YhhN
MNYFLAVTVVAFGMALILFLVNELCLGYYYSQNKWKNFFLKELPILLIIIGIAFLVGAWVMSILS